MKYNVLIMLLSVLCLFGCSSEENMNGSSSFSFNEYEFDHYGGIVNVDVKSECEWTISSTDEGIHIGLTSGYGNRSVPIHVSKNTTYEDKEYIIELKNMSGKSTSILTIKQSKESVIFSNVLDIIKPEGDVFEVKIQENNSIKDFTYPSWVTLVSSSRALTEHSYVFKVGENQTGKIRSDLITWQGTECNGYTTVTQDSYSPTSVTVEGLENIVKEGENTYTLYVLPKYVDYSKLLINTKGKCNAEIVDNTLKTKFKWGPSSIKIQYRENILFEKEIDCPPTPIFTSEVLTYTASSNKEMYDVRFFGEIYRPREYEIIDFYILAPNGDKFLQGKGYIRNIMNEYVQIETESIIVPKNNFPSNIQGYKFCIIIEAGGKEYTLKSEIDTSVI